MLKLYHMNWKAKWSSWKGCANATVSCNYSFSQSLYIVRGLPQGQLASSLHTVLCSHKCPRLPILLNFVLIPLTTFFKSLHYIHRPLPMSSSCIPDTVNVSCHDFLFSQNNDCAKIYKSLTSNRWRQQLPDWTSAFHVCRSPLTVLSHPLNFHGPAKHVNWNDVCHWSECSRISTWSG